MRNVTISKTDIYKAIWLDNNSKRGAAADFLRSLLPAKASSRSTNGKARLAIIVGHNSKKPGAYAPGAIKESEFKLNSKVAKIMRDLADSDPSIEIMIFFRKAFNSYSAQIREVYKRVNKWLSGAPIGAAFAMELHFNWLGGKGRVEMLHYPNSKKSTALAKILLRRTSQLIPGETKLVPRGASDRGGLSLATCAYPIVMTEPFDCSNEDHVDIVARIGHQAIARINFASAKEFTNFN